MQDTKNLIRKRDIEYPRLIRIAKQKGDFNRAYYWELELKRVKDKILTRQKNQKKNEKQFRKAN